MTAGQRRAAVTHVQETAAAEGHAVSQRRVCRWLGVQRTPVRYVARRPPDTELRGRLRELAARTRLGRAAPLLAAAARGPAGQLQARRTPLPRGGPRRAEAPPQARRPGARAAARTERPERALEHGLRARHDGAGPRVPGPDRRGRVHRECLAIEVDTSLPAVRVAGALDRVASTRGLPATISVDNGPEFAGRS